MNNMELFFNLANICYLTGTILLARRVINNRGNLKDFDSHGSALNVIGLTFNCVAYVILGIYITAIISFPTLIFWAIAAGYSFKNKYKKK